MYCTMSTSVYYRCRDTASLVILPQGQTEAWSPGSKRDLKTDNATLNTSMRRNESSTHNQLGLNLLDARHHAFRRMVPIAF